MLKRYINEKNALKLQLLKSLYIKLKFKNFKVLRKYFREFSIAPLIFFSQAITKIK